MDMFLERLIIPGSDTVTRLREVIKSGDRVELERSGEVVLLSAAAQLTVGKLSLIRDVKLESSSEDAMSKLTRWAIPKACGGKVSQHCEGIIMDILAIPNAWLTVFGILPWFSRGTAQ